MRPKSARKEFKANIEVLARLANAFSESRTVKKTHLYFVSRTNWSSFDRYLSWLKSNNYVECKMDEKEEKYQLTDTGRAFTKTVTGVTYVKFTTPEFNTGVFFENQDSGTTWNTAFGSNPSATAQYSKDGGSTIHSNRILVTFN